jgi:predicted RNase H-like HicB family nuclease
MRYTVVFTPEPDDNAISVRVPAMPGVFTWGTTPEGALAAAREAVELYLEQYVERGRPFPPDQAAPGLWTAVVDVVVPESAAGSRESA